MSDTLDVFRKMREFTGISEGRIAVDLESVLIIFIDDKGAKIFGYEPEEIIGEKLLTLFPPAVVASLGADASELHIQEEAGSITGNFLLPRDREGVRKDGSITSIRIRQALIKLNDKKYTFAFFDEIKVKTEIGRVKSQVSQENKDIEAKLRYADLAVNLVAENPVRTIKFISLALLAVPVFLAWHLAWNFDKYIDKYIAGVAKSKLEQRIKSQQAPQTPSPSPQSGKTDKSSP